MKRADLDDFVSCYAAGDRQKRVESERFRCFDYDALTKRDKINLDIFWLKDDSLDDPDLLPPPDEIAAEIVESLEAALDRFRKVAAGLLPSNGRGGRVIEATVYEPSNSHALTGASLWSRHKKFRETDWY